MADESTRGGQLNNRATQWEAGEGSCTVRAAAITARGSNGEHLATEHHSHSPLCLGGLRAMVVGGFKSGKKRQRLAERLAWPLRECKGERGECGRAQREKGQVWEVGGNGHQKVLCPKEYEGTCSSLLPHT